MKLKLTLLSVGALMALTSILNASEVAVSLFDAKCAVCHVKMKPADKSKMMAPAVMGLMRHVKMKYTSKEDVVDFITEYALNPNKDKAVCMPQKIKRFGLMPSQKGNVSKEELQTIAAWMYENFPAKGFKAKMHKEGQSCGAKGMSKEMKCQAGKCQGNK